MNILCLSDTHGELPELDLDGIDLVLHAGDFSCAAKHDLYKQLAYYEQVFCPWVRRITDRCGFYWISGNHEVFIEKLPLDIYANDVYTKYCIDEFASTFTAKGESIRIYGFPWTPRFYDWAYNADDTPEEMGWLCDNLENEVDILLCHGPPYGILDFVPRQHNIPPTNAGSKELAKAIKRISPKLVVFGHLHSNYGVVEKEGIKYVGCSLMDENYQTCRSPVIIDL